MKDEARFRKWWSKVSPAIRHSVAAIVGNEAQDIVQDVSVIAVMRFDEFAAYEDFSRWCHKRCHWLALDELARRRRFARDSEQILQDRPSIHSNSNAEVLRKLIERLPRQQRSVTLDRISGYTTDEIASRYQVSISTVRSLWRHAKQNLVSYFEEENL